MYNRRRLTIREQLALKKLRADFFGIPAHQLNTARIRPPEEDRARYNQIIEDFYRNLQPHANAHENQPPEENVRRGYPPRNQPPEENVRRGHAPRNQPPEEYVRRDYPPRNQPPEEYVRRDYPPRNQPPEEYVRRGYLPRNQPPEEEPPRDGSESDEAENGEPAGEPPGDPIPISAEGIAGDIKNWSIFSLLRPEFLSTIRLCCVFGVDASEALMVTTDDEVWALGSNASYCLGVGEMDGSLNEPVKVDVLSNKGVHSFAYGTEPHVLALTKEGHVYAWGNNDFYQLGNGDRCEVYSPVLVYGSDYSPAVEIACGNYHSVLRNAAGEIFTWGQNDCGQLGFGYPPEKQAFPRRVTRCLRNLKCTGIACGRASTVAVFHTGVVYAWGSNGSGQLGHGSMTDAMLPKKVGGLNDVAIQKVACGDAHTLALTNDGLLYVWGANSSGQLGIDCRANQSLPVHMESLSGRVREIAATHYADISAVMTETSKVFMWGSCRGRAVVRPLETPYYSVQDVFGAFSPATPVPIIVKPMMKQTKISIAEHFDNPLHSDLKFRVEGKIIHVHKTVLKFQCEYFRTMFQGPWLENNNGTVDVTQFSYSIYRAFLRYFYTGEVDLPATDAIELLDLANSCCEDDLKLICEQIIKAGISVENCASIYLSALAQRASDLEDFCFRFAMKHMTAVVETEAFAALPEKVVHVLIQRAAKEGAFKQ